MVVNLARTTVTYSNPTTGESIKLPAVRFVYHNGRAAVWQEDKRTRSASRVLFAEDVEFSKSTTARLPHTVTTSLGEVWSIKNERGGCGCSSPLKNISITKMLDPEFTSA